MDSRAQTPTDFKRGGTRPKLLFFCLFSKKLKIHAWKCSFEITYAFTFKLFGYYLAQDNCTLAPNSTKGHDKNHCYSVNLSTPWEFTGIQDQTLRTKLKYTGFLLIISTLERILAEIFSILSMGGVYFGHSYLYFLYISLSTNLNESSVVQFFILCLSDSQISSKGRTHRFPESKCGETDLKK